MNNLNDYSGDDVAFYQWLYKLDKLIQSKVGVNLMDLSDQPYREWFDDGISPYAATYRVLTENGFDGFDTFD
jgi:hypothetical protein